MSVVKINVLQVPEGRGEVLEQRFAARAGAVEKVDGFESFDLLRPTEGTDRYLVVTKWRDEAAFRAWMSSEAFTRGHGGGGGAPGAGGPPSGEGHGTGGTRDAAHVVGDSNREEEPAPTPGGRGTADGERQGGPAAVGSELWGFEVVTSATAAHG